MRMLSIILRSAFPSKHAEHTHQGLMRTLSIRVRNWCACWAYASRTDAHAEHMLQFFTRMLSIRIKNPNFKRAFIPCWAYASGTDAWTEHVRKELMRMLSIRISSLSVCSACASETKWGLAPKKIKIISQYFNHKVIYPERLYGVKIMKIGAIENLTLGHL